MYEERRLKDGEKNATRVSCFERTMSEYSIYLGDGDDLRIDAVRAPPRNAGRSLTFADD